VQCGGLFNDPGELGVSAVVDQRSPGDGVRERMEWGGGCGPALISWRCMRV
jgi:hypothetical protein